ncbi:MAG: glutamine--fructose-6-phosphate transaminase (isomerizing), partial [Candidatus Gracilibacteria bacterium]
MCGIFGYFGPLNNAAELALEGLKNLEYRGYDSWGVAAKLESGEIRMEKHVGKISDVKEFGPALKGQITHLA